MRIKIFLSAIAILSIFHQTIGQSLTAYQKLQRDLAKGWNTWSYGSMLSQVLLPHGLCLQINFRNAFIGTPYDPDYFFEDVQVDKKGNVRPVAHADDGSYSELLITNWYGNKIRVQSAAIGNDVVMLVTPLAHSAVRFNVELQTGFMWNRSGTIQKVGEKIVAVALEDSIVIRSTASLINSYHNYTSPYLIVEGNQALAFYTGKERSIKELSVVIEQARLAYEQKSLVFGVNAETFQAIQTVLGWNTIYDPSRGRVITPVTRGWNEAWQGYVLFEWDTYFAALLYSTHNKSMSYSNAIAITKGFNSGHVGFWQMPGLESVQSQPPVGSMVCWMIYEKFQEQWFLEEVYEDLLTWNRWWIHNRMNDGYLTWGAPWKGAEPKHALLESGLDNSPMYEHVKMVEVGNNSLFNLADVGLNSLYVADCKYLAKIASALGRKKDVVELTARAKAFTKQVQQLWNDEKGIFQNKFLDSNKFSDRLSPTLFYPMMAGIASDSQASRMMREHYYNPDEFYGPYIIPSIARNDKLYNNDYWRGSVWGPMNFLVYVGLRQYDRAAATDLAQRSGKLFLDAWHKHNYVFENINADKGIERIEDQVNSDPYYHWGALLGFMALDDSK